MKGRGCPNCGRKRSDLARTSNKENFIASSKKSQGERFDNYDYSSVKYVNGRTEVDIFCKICNDYFKQTPDSHVRGHGCSFCKNKRSRTF